MRLAHSAQAADFVTRIPALFHFICLIYFLWPYAFFLSPRRVLSTIFHGVSLLILLFSPEFPFCFCAAKILLNALLKAAYGFKDVVCTFAHFPFVFPSIKFFRIISRKY